MKNNKGLTLVELLGVLIVLSLVVAIVVPSVTKNLKLSRVEICEHQLDSLVSASKNWLTDEMNDNYNSLFLNGNFVEQTVTGQFLLENGYVSELEKEYHNVNIYIYKDGNNYVYEIKNQQQYCK